MGQRSNYWSCSKFADWIRGTKKLRMGTADEWDDWDSTSKKVHPIRHWIAEEALDAIQNFIWWPVDKVYNVKYYINNRWVTRTHALTSDARDLPRGQWCDVGYRFLPCLFNELKNYVEIELAWWHIAWDDEAKKKYKAPFWSRGWFRWRTWRCPEAGLDNLEWQMALNENGKPTLQATNARELYELYTWWTEIYHNRPDPHDASGWTAVCEEIRIANGGKLSLGSGRVPKHLQSKQNKALKLTQKIEEDYEKEDEAMLIRLIKVRHSLWT